MLAKGFQALVAEANAKIKTLSNEDAIAAAKRGEITVLDVREPDELRRTGTADGAIHVPRGFLEFMADPQSPMHKEGLEPDKPLGILCGSGGRSALAVKTLMEMGYQNVSNIAGGFQAWTQNGGPVSKDESVIWRPAG